ncbi:MAG: amidase [Chloroflexi bacterium]|nr:amidase [Chloroflexota bacterium]MCY3697030.1 amidase [Chloroflexota bacterium]
MPDPLWRRTAVELAGLIRDREVSSREVVEAHLDRIVEVNGQVNAVTRVLEDTALAAADAADGGENLGPLHGVPFTIKENIDCVGSPTTQGVPALADAMPPSDAPVVERMKRAGAIPLARTNLPELGGRLDTDNPLRGRTFNPWNPALTPGGSSGGEAAALATGMSPIGLGNDILGSLRNPAYCCGITSLKPSAGRIPCVLPMGVDAGMAVQAMLVEGPMARSVADLRLGLSILAGRDVRDPRSVDAPLEGPEPTQRRAALVTEIPGFDLPAVTVAEIRRAGEVLAADGWRVEEVEPPELDRVNEIWNYVIVADQDEESLREQEELITPQLATVFRQMGERIASAPLSNAAIHAERSRLSRVWSDFFGAYPVAVGPTWTCLPWPIDSDLDPETGMDLTLGTAHFISPGNVLGLPAVALATGVADGLPTGVQVYADRWREDLCLAAAEQIEAASRTPTPIDPVPPA